MVNIGNFEIKEVRKMKKVLAVVFSLVLLFSLSGCGLINLNYEIVEEKDVSTGEATRYAYWVVPEEKEKSEAWKRIFEELSKEKWTYDQVTVFFYSSEEETDGTYTLAKIERTEKNGDPNVELAK